MASNSTQEEDRTLHLQKTTELGSGGDSVDAPRYVSKRDGVIELIKKLTREEGKSIQEAFRYVQDLFLEHHKHCSSAEGTSAPPASPLTQVVPTVGKIFTPLDLTRALEEYDQKYSITSRKFVAPTFREIRHIFNTAQVHAASKGLQLVTFDADGTLYEDGGILSATNPMNNVIIQLLQQNLHVAIVTAAGYPHQPDRYAQRLQGLLTALQQEPEHVRNRFYVIGGECNYFFKATKDATLVELPDDDWKSPEIKSWNEDSIKSFLDQVAATIEQTAEKLNVRHQFTLIRKERAVGFIPQQGFRPRTEVVNELTLTVQHTVSSKNIPYCAFTSEYQVWVDIGNKAYGVEALQLLLNLNPEHTLHIGDQLLLTGNDFAARMRASTLWITAPKETAFFVDMLLNDVKKEASS